MPQNAIASPIASTFVQENAKPKPAVQQDDPAERERIKKLVNQLGSSNYAVRQAAVEQIWRIGKPAKPDLEKAKRVGNPEVAKRAGEILTVLEMGIDFETDPELAKLVLRFNGGEKKVKHSVLSDLMRDHRLPLVFELLQQVESDDDQRWLYNVVLNFNQVVVRYGRTGRWDEVELIHQHPLTLKFNPISVVQYHIAGGTLQPMVEKLRQQIASAEKDGKKVELKDLMELTSILRMQQRFDDAESYVAKIKKDELRNRYLNRILMEKGDWAAVAEKMPGPDQDANAQNGLIQMTDSQRALVCQFIGDEAGYRAAIKTMLERSAEATSDHDEETARQILNNVVGIAMVSLDWELAHQHLDFKDVNSTFELLIESRRVEEAFELIGLGDTVEKRDLWFNRKMRNVSSLRKKIERFEEAGEDTDSTMAKLAAVWEMCLGSTGIANTLGGLGLSDEAAAHYHTMLANLSEEEDVGRRGEVVGRLFWMGRYEEARRICEQGFSESEIENLSRQIVAPQKRTHISFWLSQLKRRHPDPLRRMHVAAGIVNSPFCGLEDFDLQLELASIEPNPKHIRSGYWDYQLAQIYQYHGDSPKFESHLQISDQAGYTLAVNHAIKQAVTSGDWQRVIEFYDSPPNNTSVYGALLAAEAYRQLGDVRKSALRTALAFASWQQNYDNVSTAYQLKAVDKHYLATNLLKLQVYHSGQNDGSEVANERYRSMLANSQLESDPQAAQNNHRVLLFDHFANGSHGGAGMYWADEVIKFSMSLAQAKISDGELDEAAQLLLKCDKFAPGDPGLGEKLIPALDEAGGTEQAQQVFEQMSNFYFDLLAKYPDSSLHHNNYAWLCACANRRKDHMLRHAKIAIEQRPDSSSYLDTLATVYFLTGEKQKAIELCRRCIEIYPTKQHYRDQLIRFTGDH